MQIYQSCGATLSVSHRTIEAYVPSRRSGGIRPCLQKVKAMILSHIVRAFQQWRRYNDSLRELNRLGDHELADIGITRSDIPRVAWEHSER
jgi:uncharacterized protein YjiS (DUF1127 family)